MELAKSNFSKRKTQIEAYVDIHRKLSSSKKRADILQTLKDYGPMTASEISLKLNSKGKMTNDNTRARLFELRASGLVEEFTSATCSMTKRKVIVWRASKSGGMILKVKTKVEKKNDTLVAIENIKSAFCDNKLLTEGLESLQKMVMVI